MHYCSVVLFCDTGDRARDGPVSLPDDGAGADPGAAAVVWYLAATRSSPSSEPITYHLLHAGAAVLV